MRAFRTLITLTLLLATSAITRSAQQEQQTQPTQPTQEVPRFRTEVANVLVDVLVLDEQGEPVAGLTRDDFEIFEDDVLQEVEGFEVIDWTSYVAQTAPQGQPTTSRDDAAVNAFPRRFIFIINRQRAETTYIRRAKQALESFVVESMAEGDEALIIDMGFSTKVLQQFRASKEETLSTIRKISMLRMDLYAGTGSDIGTRNVYETLESLGQGLGQLPGRKIVIFLSPQLLQLENLMPYLLDTVDALNQSNTSVYSINIDGLGGASAAVNESAAISSAASFALGGLFPLANETGGRYYQNMDTFEPALRRIGQENRRYYLLTYTPSNTDHDGKFRNIAVRVDRPDVEVVARRGYFARKDDAPQVTDASPPEPPAPAEPPSTPEPPDIDDTSKVDEPQPAATPTAAPSDTAPISRAPLGPSPPDQLEITNYLFPAGDEVEVPFTIALPLDMLSPAEARTLKITITEDTQGVVAEFTDRVDARNFFMVRSPKLAPGLYLLQMTLEEPSGEQIYQSSMALEVPQGFGNRFGFSSIVPVFAPSAEGSGQGQPIEIRPTTSVQRGEDAYLYFRITRGEDASSSGDDTQLSYVISRDGQEIVTGSHGSTLRLSGADETGLPVVLRLPTSGLLPGTYNVTLRIASSSLGRRARTETEFAID